MAHFFFDFSDMEPDQDGLELESPVAARKEALKALGKLAGDALSKDWLGEVAVSIRDGSGNVHYTARLVLQEEL